MKTLGTGTILQTQAATTDECLNYVWSLPISTAILGCQDLSQVEVDARQAQVTKPLSAKAMEELRRRVAGMELAALEPWKRGEAGGYFSS